MDDRNNIRRFRHPERSEGSKLAVVTNEIHGSFAALRMTSAGVLLTCVVWLAVFPAARAAEPAPLPETCYLFAYFYHDREAEGFRLAWSADGYKFEMLNEGRSYLKPTAGENKLMRDPHLY